MTIESGNIKFSYEIAMVWPPVLECPATVGQADDAISPPMPVYCSVYVTARRKRASLTRTMSFPTNILSRASPTEKPAVGEGDKTAMMRARSMARSGSSPAEIGRIPQRAVFNRSPTIPNVSNEYPSSDPSDTVKGNNVSNVSGANFSEASLSFYCDVGQPFSLSDDLEVTLDRSLGREASIQIHLPQDISPSSHPDLSGPSMRSQTLLIPLPLGLEKWSRIETRQFDGEPFHFSTCVSVPINHALLLIAGRGGNIRFRKMELCLVPTRHDALKQCVDPPVLVPILPTQQCKELLRLVGVMTIELAMPVLVLAAGDIVGGFLDSIVSRIASADQFENIPEALQKDVMKGWSNHWQSLMFDLSCICDDMPPAADAIPDTTAAATRPSGRSSFGTITSAQETGVPGIHGTISPSYETREAYAVSSGHIIDAAHPAGPPAAHHHIGPSAAYYPSSSSAHHSMRPTSHPLSDSSLRSVPQSTSQSSSSATAGSRGSGSRLGSGSSSHRSSISTPPSSAATRSTPPHGSRAPSDRGVMLPLIEHCTSFLSASEW